MLLNHAAQDSSDREIDGRARPGDPEQQGEDEQRRGRRVQELLRVHRHLQHPSVRGARAEVAGGEGQEEDGIREPVQSHSEPAGL